MLIDIRCYMSIYNSIILPTINKVLNYLKMGVYLDNMGIIPEVKLVPQAQPRDTNGRVVLFLLSTRGRKHILMSRSLTEGPNF